MKIVSQHMVKYHNTWQVLYHCEDGSYFISSNGAFGQRDMTIEKISLADAVLLLDKQKRNEQKEAS